MNNKKVIDDEWSADIAFNEEDKPSPVAKKRNLDIEKFVFCLMLRAFHIPKSVEGYQKGLPLVEGFNEHDLYDQFKEWLSEWCGL